MRAHILAMLRRHPAMYGLVRSLYRCFVTSSSQRLRKRLDTLLTGSDRLFFVQVGSNDGVQGDPINDLILRNQEWRGLFIEPVPYLFDRLQRNYGTSDRFGFENKAIGTSSGTAKFYIVSEDAKELEGGVPYWYDQLGSFEREHIVKHLDGRFEPYIRELDVETARLQDILDGNGVVAIDLLHIDTEGFDYQVLLQVDFPRYLPRLVLYEHAHLGDEERHAAVVLLTRYGYLCARFGGDTLAVQPDQVEVV